MCATVLMVLAIVKKASLAQTVEVVEKDIMEMLL